MVTVSLCMIVRNEEAVLARCLNSLKDLVDEIIIVDTGSEDRTMEIAASYTKKVYSFTWIDDFAVARNYSFSKAIMDYCMWVDADDVIEEPDRMKLKELKETDLESADIVMMKYHTAFDAAGVPIFSYYRERWIKNNGKNCWFGEVHEVIPPNGKVIYRDIAVSHKKVQAGDPDRNLKIYQKMLSENKKLDPRQQYYYGRELYYHEMYREAADVFQQFLNLEDGWVENKIEACAVCAHCYYQLKQDKMALHVLLRSLEFDVPRAELCCDIGKHFFDRQNYNQSIYWYEQAYNKKRDDKSGGFILADCYDYIPFLQLCVCYDKIGNKEKAREYNEMAGKCKPDSKEYLFNKNYFQACSSNQ